MTLKQQSIAPEFIKMRWSEPYVSAGLNRKEFRTIPRGVYAGWVVKPGPGAKEITIDHSSPEGYGLVEGYAGGDFDTASGWSIAVHQNMQGFSTTVSVVNAPGGANNYRFDLSEYEGESVYVAIAVDYLNGQDTIGNVVIVDAADLDADPSMIVLSKVVVPVVGPITEANIINDDPSYPRVMPFANKNKHGFMSKHHFELIEEIASISGSPAINYSFVLQDDGPQNIPLPAGYSYIVGGDDLWVFRNGRKQIVSYDYDEVNRGDGRGEEISLVASSAKAGDIIEFRIQEYASVLASQVQVLDEGALITKSAVYVDFSGAGVSVMPDGPSRVKVVIPGVSGGGNDLTNIQTDMIPDHNGVRSLGSEQKGVKEIFLTDKATGQVYMLDIVSGVLSATVV